MAAFTLWFSRRIFEYDVFHLIQAFYPMSTADIWYEGEKKPDGDRDADFSVDYTDDLVRFSCVTGKGESFGGEAPITDWNDRHRTKNEVKSLVYQVLEEHTGRTLPWGDLTGIRPTKIVMKLSEEGRTEDEIRQDLKTEYFVSDEKISLAMETVRREQKLMADCHTVLSSPDGHRGYSLYVDVPFCPSICLYCTFGSHRLDAFRDFVKPYFDALYKELRYVGRAMNERDYRLDTIYIGGGTPTSIPPEQLRELLGVLADNFDLDNLKEFTVEAGRPDTVSNEILAVLKEFPVTRISINPQTMVQKTLDIIGREHTTEQTIDAFQRARKAGFDNINMDMIVGLPGEGEDEVRETLDGISKLSPDSLTVHSLALKRAARLNLFRDVYEPVSFENSAKIMHLTEQTARDLGMTPYYLYRQKNMAGNFENVGYARPGKACLYNVLIMEEVQTIMACGSGASTKFVSDDGERIWRAENVKDLKNYIDRIDEMILRKQNSFE
ncbi:MAG: coproporphyrinogen dehydrogenase HemZ [Eubacteriales bacterium]